MKSLTNPMDKPKSNFEVFLENLAGRFGNIVLLGFFSLVCCIPVITAGASFTALNCAMSSYLLYEDKKPLKTFFDSFKQYFKLSTIIWLIHLVLLVVLGWDFIYYRTSSATIDILAQTAIFVLLMIVAFEAVLIFVVISQDLADTVTTCFKKAVDIAFNCFLQSIFLLIITVAIPIVCIFLIPSFILIIPGVVSFLSWQIIPNMLKKYKYKVGNASYQRSQRNQKTK